MEAGAAVALDPGFDHGDGAQPWEARLSGAPPIGGRKAHVVADEVAADLDAAVVAIGRLEVAVDRGGVVEIAPDLVVQAGLVVLDGEQVVAAAVEDSLSDLGLRPHGVDGDERPRQCQAFEQQWDGGDLVGLGLARLLAERETPAAGPGRNHVGRPAVLGTVVRSARGLAVDGDDLRTGGAGLCRPSTQAVRHWANSAPSMALMTSLRVSWLGMPALNGKKRRRKSWCIWPQRLISTKSSAPAGVPHGTSNRTSGNGNSTFHD